MGMSVEVRVGIQLFGLSRGEEPAHCDLVLMRLHALIECANVVVREWLLRPSSLFVATRFMLRWRCGIEQVGVCFQQESLSVSNCDGRAGVQAILFINCRQHRSMAVDVFHMLLRLCSARDTTRSARAQSHSGVTVASALAVVWPAMFTLELAE